MKRVKLAAACLVMVFLGYFVKSNYLHWVGPELELETDLLDFGMIEEGAPAQVYVKYKNAGLMGLKLIEASSDCGCTVVDWNTDKTGSGEVDSLLVEYDTNTVGLINRIVTINSNSADSPHSFFVIGNVVPKGSEFPSNTNTP